MSRAAPGPRPGPPAHERFAERATQLADERRRRLLWTVGAALLVLGLLYLLLLSPLLTVREVEIVGADGADRAAIEGAAGSALGTPLARVDTDAIGEEVETRPGVESATVERSWPRTLTVDVVARVPALAVENSQGEVEVYDLHGVLIRTVSTAPKGVPAVTTEGGAAVSAEGIAAARGMLEALPEAMRARVGSVTVDAADRVSFRIGATTVIWGDSSDPRRKVEIAEILLAEKPGTLDVSAPDTPVTR